MLKTPSVLAVRLRKAGTTGRNGPDNASSVELRRGPVRVLGTFYIANPGDDTLPLYELTLGPMEANYYPKLRP